MKNYYSLLRDFISWRIRAWKRGQVKSPSTYRYIAQR